ncbi:sensor histidine kinase [Promicromonospora sp. NPDC050880]|uniref:sensor histidine kinase n=1 Tax=Promicromonospora sp. NPDC050880 TaxID=3364406 RepID=UPI00378BD292
MLGTTRPVRDPDPVAPGPFDRLRPRIFVAVAVTVLSTLGSVAAARDQAWAVQPGLAGLLLLLVAPAALVFLLPRRPALATVVSVAAALTFLLLGRAWGPVLLGPVAVLAGVMLSGTARRARVIAWSGAALLAGGVGTVATLLAPRLEQQLRDNPPDPPREWGPPGPPFHGPGWADDGAWFLTTGSLVAGAAWLAVVLLVASAVRDRAARRVAARAAARETAAERERTAVASERLRIARELHDVLAHSLSAINVQAGVGLHLLEKHPGQAREALTNIRDTSRDALAEVRTVLGIVREDGAPLTPTWDLTALNRLADQARAEGLDVAVDLPPDVGDLPDHLMGVVHRVVQESLTNVRRHATSAGRVTVRLTRGDRLEVAVADDGAPAGAPAEPGYGLLGMRERVEGAGGTLTVGPRPDGTGWLVLARLPVPAARPERPGGAVAPSPDPAAAPPSDTPEPGETA